MWAARQLVRGAGARRTVQSRRTLWARRAGGADNAGSRGTMDSPVFGKPIVFCNSGARQSSYHVVSPAEIVSVHTGYIVDNPQLKCFVLFCFLFIILQLYLSKINGFCPSGVQAAVEP